MQQPKLNRMPGSLRLGCLSVSKTLSHHDQPNGLHQDNHHRIDYHFKGLVVGRLDRTHWTFGNFFDRYFVGFVVADFSESGRTSNCSTKA
jgi:hypothetical protein